MTNSRDIEHAASQGKGLARESSAAKRAWGPQRVHPSMENRTSTDIGAPSTGAPPDASAPNPLDPTRTKQYPIPEASWQMKDGDGRGIDPAAGHKVMDQAVSGNHPDFAKSLHTRLPDAVTEET